ncbi:trans-sialidase [Trypanosoma cruzi]|nr:trans-sialidase [Trypanosoma cruzi]
MIAQCVDCQSVFESRDTGATWTKAVGTLSGVWSTHRQEPIRRKACVWKPSSPRPLGKGRSCCTLREYALREKDDQARYLWLTDNSRTFHVGPLFVENAVSQTFSNYLLYSDDALHLLQKGVNEKGEAISLSRQTEEPNTVRSVPSTWAQLDASFSESSTPTAGLVGFLSNGASEHKLIDGHRCANASVTKAAKVKNGFKFTGTGTGATWPVNGREDNDQYGFANHDFTLVATVTIHRVSKESTPLLGAGLGERSGREEHWVVVRHE